MLLQEFNTSNHDSINVPYSSAVPEQISGNWDLLRPHHFAEVSIKKVTPSPPQISSIMVLKFFLIPAVVKEGLK
jgi:hypothetical protein